MSRDIATLGQIFTPPTVVRAMLALRKNTGRVLEPACGDGSFSSQLPGCVSIEVDGRCAPADSLNIDFFAYPLAEQFATIIGNPPYVRYQDIRPETKARLPTTLFDQRSNLYLFFIEKSVRHLAHGGELIFITPRDFLKTTSSVRLNQWLYTQGSITHAIELGDAPVFPQALPNCLIWRFEKGCFARGLHYAALKPRDQLDAALAAPAWEPRFFMESAGHFMFAKTLSHLYLQDIACVKVGAVSGADAIYADATYGNLDFVCAHTVKTGKTRKMIWVADDARPPAALLPHKARLIQRRIRRFDESNWWHWGRSYPLTAAPRVYVNAKTRQQHPFFLHPCLQFDGAVLAVFPHDPHIDLAAFCAALNEVAWDQLGFVCGGRYLFSQRSLTHAPLPETMRRFLPKTAWSTDKQAAQAPAAA